MRVFIVTTVRDPGPPLVSFVRYHLSIGVAHLFVYFDDPSDAWLPVARGLEGVTAIACTPELRDRQVLRSAPAASLGPFLHKEVMARQVLNADDAIERGLQLGGDWLLHLDVDELFHSAGSVNEHFAGLPPAVGQVSYLNHEAAPEKADLEDYFRVVTLFKRNPALCAGPSLGGWLRGSGRRWYFLAYDNGKSAVRLLPGAMASSVHAFVPPPAAPRALTLGEPSILHYANCGFEYYRRKYRQRGAFSDRYFDRWPRIPFHLQSRDLAASGDELAQREFYSRHVVYSKPEEIGELMAAGLGIRLAVPPALREPA